MLTRLPDERVSTPFPYTTLFRSERVRGPAECSNPIGYKPSWQARERKSMSCSCGSPSRRTRSEEHTSELQSLRQLVCRLLCEKRQIQRPQAACRRAAWLYFRLTN